MFCTKILHLQTLMAIIFVGVFNVITGRPRCRCLATHTGRPRCVHKYNGRLKGSKGMLYRNVARKDGRVGRAEVAEAEVISDPHAWMAGMEDCSDS